MAIIHILKDGTRVDDITGHVVRFEDAEPLYRMMAGMYTSPKERPRKQPSRTAPAPVHNPQPKARA